jgi:hypothetical protein
VYCAFIGLDIKMYISFLRGMGTDRNQVLYEQGALQPHTDHTILNILKPHFHAGTDLLHVQQGGNGEHSVPPFTDVTLPYGPWDLASK